jgi:hypothetical protein
VCARRRHQPYRSLMLRTDDQLHPILRLGKHKFCCRRLQRAKTSVPFRVSSERAPTSTCVQAVLPAATGWIRLQPPMLAALDVQPTGDAVGSKEPTDIDSAFNHKESNARKVDETVPSKARELGGIQRSMHWNAAATSSSSVHPLHQAREHRHGGTRQWGHPATNTYSFSQQPATSALVQISRDKQVVVGAAVQHGGRCRHGCMRQRPTTHTVAV